MIVINSAEVAFDLLERRGQIYADRPNRPLLHWTGEENDMNNAPYGPIVQQTRRLVKSVAGKAGAEEHEATMAAEVHRFLRRILNDPESIVQNIQLSSGSTVLDINYGYDVLSLNDPMFKLLLNATHSIIQLIVERASLPEFFPSLIKLPSFVPGAHLYDIAKIARDSSRDMVTKPFFHVQKQLAMGTARPSFVAHHISDSSMTPEKEKLIHNASSALFIAGYETTVIGVYSAVLALMLYPEVQARAQAELDSVVGSDRLATLRDRDELPYVVAIVKEALRWMPPAPEGVPHRARQDDEYKGYHIPKGTTVVVNIRGICLDPAEYPNPHVFDPTRFLGDNQQRDPGDLVFGFGRRICPGQPFAEASIFLHVSAMLSMFNLSQTKDSPPIDREDMDTHPTYPAPPPCHFELRSEASRSFVNSALFRDE